MPTESLAGVFSGKNSVQKKFKSKVKFKMIQNVDTKGNLNLKVKSRYIRGNCCCRFLQIYLIAYLVTNNFQHDTNYVLCPYKIMVDKI